MPPATSVPFPLYLIPSIPFRRRRSSNLSTSPLSSPSGSPPSHPTAYLASTSASHLRCSKCLADLIPTASIISKGFTGRHGRAYLVAPLSASSSGGSPIVLPPTELRPGDLPNTRTHKPVPRQLVTGAHTVSDISCLQCGSVLGWKYVAAEEESQRYKVGKYILETKRVVNAARWEEEEQEMGGGSRTGADAGTTARSTAGPEQDEAAMEFDSGDEDECEDLFAGVWSQRVAGRRSGNNAFSRQRL